MYGEVGHDGEGSSVEEEEGELQWQQVHIWPCEGRNKRDTRERQVFTDMKKFFAFEPLRSLNERPMEEPRPPEDSDWVRVFMIRCKATRLLWKTLSPSLVPDMNHLDGGSGGERSLLLGGVAAATCHGGQQRINTSGINTAGIHTSGINTPETTLQEQHFRDNPLGTPLRRINT